MSRPARVVDVEHLGDFGLRLTFSDGLVRELDFEGVLEGEIFEALWDRAMFAQVSVDTVAGRLPGPTASTSILTSCTVTTSRRPAGAPSC